MDDEEWIVRLTFGEMQQAAHVGILRRLSSIYKKRPSMRIFPGTEPWDSDVESSAAEAAVSKKFNVHWMGALGELDAKDVAGNEVRWTRGPQGVLAIRPKDEDRVPVILVTGQLGTYHLRGWIYAGEGRKLVKPGGEPPYWRIPITSLNPMKDL